MSEKVWSIAGTCKERQLLFDTFPHNPLRLMLELLVSISNSLSPEDFTNLGPLVWSDFLESDDPKTTAAVRTLKFLAWCKLKIKKASFLVMQCAEKASESFISSIKSDLSRYFPYF